MSRDEKTISDLIEAIASLVDAINRSVQTANLADKSDVQAILRAIADGPISDSDQKLLDGILRRAERQAKKLEKLDNLTP